MARVTVEVPEEPTEIQDSVESVSESEPPSNLDTQSAVTPETVEPSPESSSMPRDRIKMNSKNLVIIGVVGLVVVLVVMLVNANQERNKLKQEAGKALGTQTKTEDEAKALKAELGQFLELPADEVPTVATVADASKVKTQSFFANSQNGDKVLIFSKAGKAVLYRPSTKKIIELAPINLNNPEATPPPATQTPVAPQSRTTR